MRLTLVPLTQTQGKAFVGAHHRHNLPPLGDLFRVGLDRDGTLVAVGIAGRPLARPLDDGRTIEILRVCTLGDDNACSRLYGALCRAGAALGYLRAFTYTLASEPGTSPKAAGFTLDAELDGRPSWSTPSRLRDQQDLFGEERRPPEAKHRWRRDLT